jgi:hypothetical protein
VAHVSLHARTPPPQLLEHLRATFSNVIWQTRWIDGVRKQMWSCWVTPLLIHDSHMNLRKN